MWACARPAWLMRGTRRDQRSVRGRVAFAGAVTFASFLVDVGVVGPEPPPAGRRSLLGSVAGATSPSRDGPAAAGEEPPGRADTRNSARARLVGLVADASAVAVCFSSPMVVFMVLAVAEPGDKSWAVVTNEHINSTLPFAGRFYRATC